MKREHKKAISRAMMGKQNSLGKKNALGNRGMKGRVFTKAHKNRIAASQRLRWAKIKGERVNGK